MSVKDQIDKAVSRFLAWKVPRDFYPDCYISFDRDLASQTSWPTGTNLMSADQARHMFEHCFDGTDEPDYKALYEVTFKELQKALEEVQSLKSRPQAIKAAPKLSPEDEVFHELADRALREMAITKEKRLLQRVQSEREIDLQRTMDALKMKMIYESGLPPSVIDSVIKISTT